MTIQQFIEKAIEGEWNAHPTQKTVALQNGAKVYFSNPNDDRAVIPLTEILLDPEAWKAVGKVEGWLVDYDTTPEHDTDNHVTCWCRPKIEGVNGEMLPIHQDRTWRGYWHAMIDALAEGKSVEEYLETL